jgi:hypothetical protein
MWLAWLRDLLYLSCFPESFSFVLWDITSSREEIDLVSVGHNKSASLLDKTVNTSQRHNGYLTIVDTPQHPHSYGEEQTGVLGSTVDIQ